MASTEDLLITKLEAIQKLVGSSKTRRIFSRPFKYLKGVGFRKIIYPISGKGFDVQCHTFFGSSMAIRLPGSMDIYLFGAKTHDSELRLAKFFVKNIVDCKVFIDVGAHVGYFSLLINSAAKSHGLQPEIFAIEPSAKTFRLLKKNISEFKNIHPLNLAVSDSDMKLTYYQFSDLYSEYNSLEGDLMSNESWYGSSDHDKTEVEGNKLDTLVEINKIIPTIIKIDVEGAEDKVISGSSNTLAAFSPVIVMEFLSDEKKNSAHKKAHELLVAYGYRCFFIDKGGSLQPCANPVEHIMSASQFSDNLVYTKGR